MTSGIECAFSGRLGKHAELRHVRGGELPLLNLTIAVEERIQTADAPTIWARVALFGQKAEELAPRLVKGTRCYVEGRLQPVKVYQAHDGSHRASLEIVATLCQPLGQIGRRRPRQNTDRQRSQQMRAPADRWVDDDTEAAMADLEGRE